MYMRVAFSPQKSIVIFWLPIGNQRNITILVALVVVFQSVHVSILCVPDFTNQNPSIQCNSRKPDPVCVY